MALQVLRHLHNWSLRKEKLLKEDTLLQHKSIKIIKLKQEDTVCIAQSTPPIVVEMESIIPAKKRKSAGNSSSFTRQKSIKLAQKIEFNISLLRNIHHSKLPNKTGRKTALKQKVLQNKYLPLSKKINKLRSMRKKFLKCQYCFHKFPTELILFNHEKICLCTSANENPRLFAKELSSFLYPCDSCCEKFINQQALDQHLKCEHRSRPTCNKCFKMFECRRRLVEHEEVCAGMLDGKPIKKQTHGLISFICTSDIYICSKCENPFPSQDHLRQHQILLRKKVPIDIVFEEGFGLPAVEEFNNSEEYEETSRTMEISVNNVASFRCTQPFQLGENSCTYCGKIFQSNARLLNHGHICKKKLAYSCYFCSKQLRSKFRLNNHLSSCLERKFIGQHEKSNLTRFKCQYCDQFFPLKSHHKHHIQIEHRDVSAERKIFKSCMKKEQGGVKLSGSVLCGSYSKSSRFKLCVKKNCNKKPIFKPLLSVKSIPPKSLSTSTNNLRNKKVFVVKNLLEKNPFICKYCDFICMSEQTFTDHIQGKHKNFCKSFHLVSCKNCFNVYLNKQDLSNHFCNFKKTSDQGKKNTHSGNSSISDTSINAKTSDVFSCLNCLRSFRLEKSYLRHIQICKVPIQNIVKNPNGNCILNQLCYVCGCTFDNIVMHLIVHSLKKPFCCTECNYCSGQALATYKHMQKKHNIVHEVFNHQNPDIHSKAHGFENCSSCQNFFLNGKDLSNHSEQGCKQSPKAPNKKCTVQTRKDTLKQSTTLQCMKCSIHFKSKKFLLFHLKACPYQNNIDPSVSAQRKLILAKKKVNRCPNCSKSFKYKLPLKKHINSCSRSTSEEQESLLIKPAGPTIESLLAEKEETEVDVAVLVSLEDAKESLISLITDDNTNKSCKEDVQSFCSSFVNKRKKLNHLNKLTTAVMTITAATTIAATRTTTNATATITANATTTTTNAATTTITNATATITNATATITNATATITNATATITNATATITANGSTTNAATTIAATATTNATETIAAATTTTNVTETIAAITATTAEKTINFCKSKIKEPKIEGEMILSEDISFKVPVHSLVESPKKLDELQPHKIDSILNAGFNSINTEDTSPSSPAIVCSFRIYPCRKCGISFSLPEVLENHLLSAHTTPHHTIGSEVNPVIQNTYSASSALSNCTRLTSNKRNYSSLLECKKNDIDFTKRDVTFLKLTETPVILPNFAATTSRIKNNCYSSYSLAQGNESSSVVTDQIKNVKRYRGCYAHRRFTTSPPIAEGPGIAQFISCSSIPYKKPYLHENFQYAADLPTSSPVFFDHALSSYITPEPFSTNLSPYNPSNYNAYFNSSSNYQVSQHPAPHSFPVISDHYYFPPLTEGRQPGHNMVLPRENLANKPVQFVYPRLQPEYTGYSTDNSLIKIPLTVAESNVSDAQLIQNELQTHNRLPPSFLNESSSYVASTIDKSSFRVAEENFRRQHDVNAINAVGTNSLEKSFSCAHFDNEQHYVYNNLFHPSDLENNFIYSANLENNLLHSADLENNFLLKSRTRKTNFVKNKKSCAIENHQSSLTPGLPTNSIEIIQTLKDKRHRRKQLKPRPLRENYTTVASAQK